MADHPGCTCPRGMEKHGTRLEGIGTLPPAEVRLSTAADCPIHNEHDFVGTESCCGQCHGPIWAWIHSETRTLNHPYGVKYCPHQTMRPRGAP